MTSEIITRSTSALPELVRRRLGFDPSKINIESLNHERAFMMAYSARYPGTCPLNNKHLFLSTARDFAPTIRSVVSPFARIYFDIPPLPKKMFPSEEGLERAAILLKGKSGYLKPIQGSCAMGVLRMNLDETGTLVMRGQDLKLLTYLYETFSNVAKMSTIHPSAELSGRVLTLTPRDKGFDLNTLGTFFDILEERFLPFPHEIAKRIGGQKPFWGLTTFEEAIQTPLVTGPDSRPSTWEIRVINQSLGKKVDQHSYAKVGGDEVIGNIATGGTGLASLTAIGLAYRNLLPEAPAERIEKLARGYLERTQRYARRIVRGLSETLTNIRGTLSDYPFPKIPVTDISTDFMGRVRGQVLIPTVIDINLFYGASGLEATDPAGYGRVIENQQRIVAAFQEDLLRLS